MPIEDALKRTQDFGMIEIVIKHGSEVCLVESKECRCKVPTNNPSKEQVVYTTAAGYLSARLTGYSPEESDKQRHLVAGTVTQHRGAIIPLYVIPKQ